jgi:Spx/MgsR family transcriptional regulator
MVRIYGIKNCDTMKKAFAWLDKNKVAYQFHDYRKDGVPAAKLAAWAKRAGWEKLANMRGTTWRKIPDAHKERLDADAALELLEHNPGAIRRPIVEAGDRLLIGFDPAEFEKGVRAISL